MPDFYDDDDQAVFANFLQDAKVTQADAIKVISAP